MAGEIQLAHGTTGRVLYAVVRSFLGTIWNTAETAFEAYDSGNWTEYAVTMTEQGTSGYYAGDMPAVPAGVYPVEVRHRAGGSPATTDTVAGVGPIEWSGTAVVALSTRSATGDQMAVTPGAAEALVAALEASIVDGTLTRLQVERLVLAALAGNVSGDGAIYYAPGTSTPRLTVAATGVDGRIVTRTP